MRIHLFVNRQRGFTLIELLVVVLIAGVLARIAYGSYTTSVAKGRRNAAQGCVMELAQYMERVYTTSMSYAGTTLPSSQCQTDLSTYYSFSIPTATASAFTVQASATGTQATKDSACTPLTVDQTGARTPASGCW